MRTTSRRLGAQRRPTLALALSLLALLLAIGAAFAPARKLRTHYSWPPKTLPAAQQTHGWYTPMLLARHEPAAMSVSIPCGARPLRGAGRPTLVLSTTRDPEEPGGMAIRRIGRRLSVTLGGAELVHADAGSSKCVYSLLLNDGSWSLTGEGRTQNGNLTMPTVEGLFSDLDLRRQPRPAVTVTSVVYATGSTVGQAIARVLAVLTAVAALVLLALPLTRPRWRPRRPHVVDGAVVALLLAWWVLSPAYFDDGWIEAGERNFLATGNFSAYYDSFGVASSLQYWLQWLEHWLFDASHSLLILRLPALLFLIATWFVCRAIFARTAAAHSRAALWALASMFCVGAFAWGMTLRPEPAVALLITSALLCTVLHLERGTTGPLIVAAVIVALALTAHPAGLLALAPMIVVAPRLLSWARARIVVAATIVVAALALAAALVVLGSDVVQFHATTASLRAHGAETAGWRDELTRYGLLARPLYGAPLRREWVVLALLAVFAYLLRRRRETSDLFAPALGVGLLLLIVTPAKIPWHFGALIGVAAVAIAAETARFAAGRGLHVRPFIAIGAAMAAAAWAWFPRNSWSDLDLRTLSWTLSVERHVTFAKVAGLVPLFALIVLALVWRRIDTAAWRTAALTAPLIAVPLIAFTMLVLVADAKKTHGWTLTSQNLDALRNDTRCGLADDVVVPSPASLDALNAKPHILLGPAPARSQWFKLPSGRFGFFASGDSNAADSLQLEWGRRSSAGVKVLGADGIPDPALGDPSPDLVAWRFLPAGSLPPRPANADAVRVVLQTTSAPGGSLSITAPVTYDDEPLANVLGRERPALALPNLLTYVPCIRQPAIRASAEVPRLIVAQQGSLWPIGSGTSPFDGVPRVYNLVRLPLTDSSDPPADVAVYVVDRRTDGGAVLTPPVVTAG